MKKNLYYRSVFGRTGAIKEAALASLMYFCSIPRLLLEVFTRKNFGERYYSFSLGVACFIILALFPLLSGSGLKFIISPLYSLFDDYGYSSYRYRRNGNGVWLFFKNFLTWYLYLGAFLYMCIQRQKEIKRLPSVFDFARFSLSTGTVHPRFFEVKINGKPASIRTVETLLEPCFFLAIGLLLLLLRQPLGILITICSFLYWVSYRVAYHQGDHFIMDKIDEMICNEEMVSSFVEGRDASETRGVSFYGRRPADPDTRRKLVDSFMEEDVVEAV